jgi:hypothetical protein
LGSSRVSALAVALLALVPPASALAGDQVPQPAPPVISLCGAGTAADDLIVCGAENDTLAGLAGADRIFSGDGNDVLNGGDGDDILGGGPGNDALNGQPGDDSLDGGTGADRLSSGRGNDVARGGSGADVVNARDHKPGDVVSCGSGRDLAVADRGDLVSRDCERRSIRR